MENPDRLNEADEGVREMSVFNNGRSQAVRIPKEMAFQGKKVLMKREGNRLIIEEKETTGRATKLRALIDQMRARGPIEDEWPDMSDKDLLEPDEIKF
ncbi:MAG: AbrB/MazE/SpoVT family DNA-binding domain-containing protein [Pseudomonadota bacterium]